MELSRRDFMKGLGMATGGFILCHSSGLVKPDRNVHASAPEVGMLVDISKCIGCWWCYGACKQYNGLPETIKPVPEEAPELSPETWSTLFALKNGEEWSFRKQACMHCTDAACVRVCPTGALSYNQMGFVQYDKEKCSGCGYCADFCPFGVPQMNGSNLSGIAVMDKCTFCIDRVTNDLQPACADACPTGAIKFGQRSQLISEGKQRIAELKQSNVDAHLYGESELEGLHVMYVLDDAPSIYGLPSYPEVPATVEVLDILQWTGIGLTAAAVAGFGLNYLLARKTKLSSKSPDKEDK